MHKRKRNGEWNRERETLEKEKVEWKSKRKLEKKVTDEETVGAAERKKGKNEVWKRENSKNLYNKSKIFLLSTV